MTKMTKMTQIRQLRAKVLECKERAAYANPDTKEGQEWLRKAADAQGSMVALAQERNIDLEELGWA